MVVFVISIPDCCNGESADIEVMNAPTIAEDVSSLPPSSSLNPNRFLNDNSKAPKATSIPNHPLPFLLYLPRFLLSLSISMMLSVVSRTESPGTAKPMPALLPEVEMIMVLMPTTWPLRLRRGPPELPGLMLASVCMQFLMGLPVIKMSIFQSKRKLVCQALT